MTRLRFGRALLLVPVIGGVLVLAVWSYLDGFHHRRGLGAFADMMRVVQHPRCLNCHQSHQPRVRDKGKTHWPRLKIGDLGLGLGGHRCAICHRATNNDLTGIPGARGWRKPPYLMSWNGLAPGDICANLKDEHTNGGRDLAAILAHVAHDRLIKWAWAPGKPRAPAPSSHSSFVENTRTWIEAGAPCPAPPTN